MNIKLQQLGTRKAKHQFSRTLFTFGKPLEIETALHFCLVYRSFHPEYYLNCLAVQVKCSCSCLNTGKMIIDSVKNLFWRAINSN